MKQQILNCRWSFLFIVWMWCYDGRCKIRQGLEKILILGVNVEKIKATTDTHNLDELQGFLPLSNIE